MRNLLKIMVVGFIVFMVLAVGQEWSFFAQAWFGAAPSVGPVLDEAQQRSAVESVRSYLALVSHLYGSAGDPRFAERIAASPEVVGEMMADIAYLRRNARYQEMALHGLEVIEVVPVSSDRVQVRTKEYWTIRTRYLADDADADQARAQIQFVTYRLEWEGSSWQVQGWSLDDPPAPPDSGGSR